MRKVAIFSGTNEESLEDEIRLWLRQNREVEIYERLQSLVVKDTEIHCWISIWYDDTTEGDKN